MRATRPVLALTLAAAGLACAEARLPTDATPSAATAVARLVLQATVSGARAGSAGTAVRVVASYARTAAPAVLIAMDSQTVALGGGSISAPLQLNVSPCVMDPARELPAGVALAAATARQLCVVHAAFALLDAGGAVLDRAAVTVTTEAGATTTAPAVVLTSR